MSFSQDQIRLQAHIEEENRVARERAEAEGRTLLGETQSDPKHWARYGITTIAEYDHYQASETYSSLYRTLNGIKPRWIPFEEMTTEEIEEKTQDLVAQMTAEEERLEELKKSEQADIKARREANKYQPNHAFAGLRDMMK